MIINRNGAAFTYGSITYRIGDRVYANDQSDYEGLYGVITEIRTDEDKETENDTPDVYCCFDIPSHPLDVKTLEERFSKLYQTEKKIDELGLDMVIMAPEMLLILTEFRSDGHKITLFHLQEDWADDGDYGQSNRIYADYHAARSEFLQRLSEEKENGSVPNWLDRSDFCEEYTQDQYECWLDGEYCEYHYKLSLAQVTVGVSDQIFGQIGRAYIDESRREDLISQVEQWDECSQMTEEQYQKFISDPAIADMIDKELGRNDTYWECFWESVSDVAHSLLRKHLQDAEKPACYTPERDNPYPLCIGQNRDECGTCCLYAHMEGEGGIE